MSAKELEDWISQILDGDGLYAGQFPDEAISEACKRGLISLAYSGAGSLFGLAKIKVSQ